MEKFVRSTGKYYKSKQVVFDREMKEKCDHVISDFKRLTRRVLRAGVFYQKYASDICFVSIPSKVSRYS